MINRREFMIGTSGMFLSARQGAKRIMQLLLPNLPDTRSMKTKISLVKTSDRQTGIMKAVELLGINPVRDKNVLLKPNFNTADRYPGSTHNDTLISLIRQLKHMGARSITIGERSGPPDTADVLKQKDIYAICRKYGCEADKF